MTFCKHGEIPPHLSLLPGQHTSMPQSAMGTINLGPRGRLCLGLLQGHSLAVVGQHSDQPMVGRSQLGREAVTGGTAEERGSARGHTLGGSPRHEASSPFCLGLDPSSQATLKTCMRRSLSLILMWLGQ